LHNPCCFGCPSSKSYPALQSLWVSAMFSASAMQSNQFLVAITLMLCSLAIATPNNPIYEIERGNEAWVKTGRRRGLATAEASTVPRRGALFPLADVQLQISAPMVAIRSLLFFSGSDDTHGFELWATDGLQKTWMVNDYNYGQFGSDPQFMTEFQG